MPIVLGITVSTLVHNMHYNGLIAMCPGPVNAGLFVILRDGTQFWSMENLKILLKFLNL